MQNKEERKGRRKGGRKGGRKGERERFVNARKEADESWLAANRKL